MSYTRYLSVKERQSSLSSVYSSSMESLFSSHGADSCWSIDQELAPTSTANTTPRFRAGYDTGFSAAEFDEEKSHSKKNGRVRKVRIVSLNFYIAGYVVPVRSYTVASCTQLTCLLLS